MKPQALQELVKQIFNDEKTRQDFTSNPEKVLAGYKLTEPEKRAVLACHARLGLVTSGSPQMEAAIAPMDMWYAPSP